MRLRRRSSRSPGRRHRRRWMVVVAMLPVLAVGALYALGYAPDPPRQASELADLGETPEPTFDDEPVQRDPVPEEPPPIEPSPVEGSTEEPAPEAEDSAAAAAYRLVAPEVPEVDRESVRAVYRSADDPSWASVRVGAPGESVDFIVFLQRIEGSWRAQRSILADEPDHPENERAVLSGVPEDLVSAVYLDDPETAGVREEGVEARDLPDAGPAELPPADPASEDVPDGEREQVEASLEEIRDVVEGYDGIAGVYVRDLEGGWGYGVRPGEEFFSASVIKIPVMTAVYRKVDSGELSLQDGFATTPEDWAAGAGTLQYEPAGTYHTVEEYLRMMMTRSDNVATNALTRIVGGPGPVNEVARDLGAEDTVLYWKVASERGVVPSVDNRTTPQDMAAMMASISGGEAASPESCREMVSLMRQNEVEQWSEEGLPGEAEVANKAGWLYKVFNDVAIVEGADRDYAVAILTKHGSKDPTRGKEFIGELSRAVWQAQNDEP